MSNKFKNPYLQVTDQLTGGSEPKNPYLQHGWGNSAKAKQKEKEYNRKYYEEHKKDKWGVGVGTRSASAPKENKFTNGLKRFGQSVNESLQKHNDNWQRGMDMILNKNVTSQTTPASTMQKKKVNPYKATGMANNERSKADAIRRNAQAARANAYAQSEQARQLDSKHKANSRAAQTSRANAYAQNEMARRANQDSEVIRNAQRAKEGARMQEDIQNKLMAQYGRQKYEEEMQKAAKDKQQKQYQSEYLNAKNTKEKMANESYAQANAANRNRMAKLDKQISDLQKERDAIEYYYNAHGNTAQTAKTEEARRATYKQDQEDRYRMSEIDQQLKKLNQQRDSLVGRHNGMVDTANTWNASRDTTKENYEKNSKEHAAVTKKINDYNNKIAKAASQYEEAKQHVTALKNNKNSGYYANGDVWANHKMRWEDNMSKAADELDALVKQRDALKKKQKELEEALR